MLLQLIILQMYKNSGMRYPFGILLLMKILDVHVSYNCLVMTWYDIIFLSLSSVTINYLTAETDLFIIFSIDFLINIFKIAPV